MAKGSTTRRTRKGAASAGESQVAKEVRRLNKEVRHLLANARKDIRQVRGEVSQLKKVGIVSKRIDARNYIPSKYMLSKLRKNADVLSGDVIAVPAKAKVRKAYVSKGLFEQRGGSLIVPREYANQRTRINRGMVELTRSLAMGEERKLILPFKPADMEGVAHRLQDDPTLDGMKQPDELFGFRLYGHNMNTIGFPTAEELADYILKNYAHLFNNKNGKSAVKHFQLIRFRARHSQLSDAPEEGRIYTPRKKRPQNDWQYNRKLQRDAARKAEQRDRETPEEYEKRILSQRARSAKNRQQKFNDK